MAKNISRPKKIVEKPVDGLIPYASNARTHSDEQVSQIAASIKEFGFTNPILLDGADGIIAGHGRVLAARQLGMKTVPALDLGHLSDAQRRAYVLADNKLAENAGWDDGLLRMELGALSGEGFDLALLGFSDLELSVLLSDQTKGLTDPDEIPAAQPPVTVSGDVWALGRHRLLCGDATDEAHVARALGDSRPHLMVTDPPYGVDYDPEWRNRADMAVGRPTGGRAIGTVTNDDQADWRAAWALFLGDVAYVWHGGSKAAITQDALLAAGFEVRAQIIWAKNNFVISRGHYHGKHEPCWYAARKGKPGHWQGSRSQTTVWDIDKPMKSETGHSTQKPVECMRRPIENNSAPGDAIYDPFVGSGTTIIAAEMTGRTCLAIDIDPTYVDVAVIRWQNFTGQQATQGGRTFDQIASQGRQKTA